MDKTVTEWQIMFTMTSGLEDFYTEDEDEYNEKFQDLIDDGDLQYVEQCIRKDYVWNEELEDWDEDYVEVLYDAENYDDYKDTQRGSVANEYKYKVSSYYDMKYLGLEDTFYTNDWSEVEDEAHKKLMQGNCVLIQNLITGKEIKLNPDEYDETFDGEFLVKPDQLEESKDTNNAYYEKADEWWEKNGERAVKYVSNETPEAVVNLFGYSDNPDDNAAWDMYVSSTAKSIALELYNFLGPEEFEKVLDEYEKNLNESYVSYEEPYNGKKMSKAQWKEIYDKDIDKKEWSDFDSWWYDMTKKDKLIVKESAEDDFRNMVMELHSYVEGNPKTISQELKQAISNNTLDDYLKSKAAMTDDEIKEFKTKYNIVTSKKTESKETDRQLRTNYKKAMERELEKVQDAIANAGPGDISGLEDRRDFLMDKLDQIDSDLEKKEESIDVTIDDVKDMFNNLPDNIKSYLENTDNVPTKEIEGTLWFDITQEEKEQLEQFVNYIDTISEDVWRKWDEKTKLNMSSYANNADRICRNCTLKLESKNIKTESKDNKVEVEHYHLEDMGGHTMAVFGSLKDGRYFAGNEEVMTLYDEDIWPQYCEDDPDTTVWEKEHTLLSTSRYDTNKENLQLYYDIISQTSFFDEDDLVWFKEHLGLDNNDVADKKNESKLVEKTNIELQEEIEEKINNAIYQYLIKDGYETDESAKEFIKDYVVVKTWYEDMTSASSAEILEKYLAVEVRAELDYDDLSTLSSYLDKVVQKYDASSYFDFITGGTIRAYIQIDTTKKTEDIVRTDIPNGNVNVSLSGARETLAELEDLENAVDNMQYADAISEKFAEDLYEFEDGPIASEKEKLTKAIGDTETRELNNMKKPKRGRKKTEGKEVNRANALLDLINEVYDGMGDMAELAEWAEILADDYNIDIDDENMETDEIMLTAFNKMNDNDFRNEVNNFIESLFENDGIEYLKDTLHTYPRNLKHIVQCLNTIKPYASEPDKIDTAIEELKSVNMNLRTTAEEFQEYLHNNFKPWTVLGTTTGPRTYVNLFEVPTDYDIVGADYFNYADRPSDMLDHIGYGWKQDGNNIVADLIGFKDSVKVGDNYAVAVYDQAPVKYGYSATIDSSNKEAKFKEMANALMSKAKEIKEKYNLKESKNIKTEAFWDDGKLYNYKGIDIQQSISDRGEKLYSILNNQKPFSIPDFSTLSAAKKYIDDNNLKSYKEKQESKKTEAVNIEDVNIEKEKEKVADDIQTAGVKDMIDTEKELEDGIKKEVYQFAKQQGLDLEKLRKQGVELETIADTIDTVIGDMVSKTAIEYMDQTNQEINWDFEIVGNDIKIVWEKK